MAAGPSFLYWRRMKYTSWIKFILYSTFYSTEFVWDLKHCQYLLQGNPLTQSLPQQYVFIQCVCLRPAAHVLPLFTPHPSRLCLNATEMSVTFTGYMWTAVPGCAQESPLLLQCHLWFGALWQRPLSQALRVSWVRLAWNSTVPDGRVQRPQGRCEANDETWLSPLPLYKHLYYCTNDRVKVLCSKHWDSISWKMTLHRMSLEYFYFILKYLRYIRGKWDCR